MLNVDICQSDGLLIINCPILHTHLHVVISYVLVNMEYCLLYVKIGKRKGHLERTTIRKLFKKRERERERERERGYSTE